MPCVLVTLGNFGGFWSVRENKKSFSVYIPLYYAHTPLPPPLFTLAGLDWLGLELCYFHYYS